jgi:hypothetical protein
MARDRLEARATSLTGKTRALAAEGLSATATPADRAAVIQVLTDLHDTVCDELEALLASAYGIPVTITGTVTSGTPHAAEEVAA